MLLVSNDLHILQQNSAELRNHGLPQSVRAIYSGRRGWPRLEIDEQFLRYAYRSRSIAWIANILGVHRCTVRHALLDYGLTQPLQNPFADDESSGNDGSQVVSYTRPLSRISDVELDEEVRRIRDEEGFSRAGVTVLHGLLLTKGLQISRERIRCSLVRVDPDNRVFRSPPIRRRTYDVPGPNAIWHHDGQHGALITHALSANRALIFC